MILPAPSILKEVFNAHKETWTDQEKKLVHEKLNQHGISDGINDDDQAVTELMCMLFIDGVRKGRETCPCLLN